MRSRCRRTAPMTGLRQDEVAPLVRIALFASLGSLDDVVHLACGDVMQHVALTVVVGGFQIRVHGVHLRTEQGIHVAFLGAVSVDLHEYPFRPALHVDTGANPVIDALRRR